MPLICEHTFSFYVRCRVLCILCSIPSTLVPFSVKGKLILIVKFWKYIRLKTKINVGKWDVLTIFIFFIVELNWCWFGTINTLITTKFYKQIVFFFKHFLGKEWNCVGDDKRVFDRVVYFILRFFLFCLVWNISFFG